MLTLIHKHLELPSFSNVILYQNYGIYIPQTQGVLILKELVFLRTEP